MTPLTVDGKNGRGDKTLRMPHSFFFFFSQLGRKRKIIKKTEVWLEDQGKILSILI